MQSPAVIAVSVRPSRRLAALLLATHFLAALSIFLASLPASLALILLAGVGASFARQRKPQVVFALMLRGDGRVEKVLRSGTGATAIWELHPLTTRLGPLVVLLFRVQGRLKSLVLLPDSVEDALVWHELLLWLRWRVQTGQATP